LGIGVGDDIGVNWNVLESQGTESGWIDLAHDVREKEPTCRYEVGDIGSRGSVRDRIRRSSAGNEWYLSKEHARSAWMPAG
jgi:hypothetical protein